jgi:hypothetical protein
VKKSNVFTAVTVIRQSRVPDFMQRQILEWQFHTSRLHVEAYLRVAILYISPRVKSIMPKIQAHFYH